MALWNILFNNPAATKNAEQQNRIEKSNSAFHTLALLSVGIVILLILYAWKRSETRQQGISILSIILLIAFASFAVGTIIGFLFGIPRTLQHNETNAKNQGDSSFQPNTNLEQISDWITKILVGVGLTQVSQIATNFTSLSKNLGHSLTGIPLSEAVPLSGMLIIFFLIAGFLFAYLWTRLFLAKIQNETIEKKIEIKLEYTDQNDKQATSIAYNQLNLPEGEDDVPVKDLLNVFKKASGNVLNTIFFQAVNVRQIWPKDKARIQRTIPVFRALITLDSGLEFPENYRELGFALKDQSTPDYKEAYKYLTKAINGFIQKKDTAGIGIVYYNRAICKIKLDKEFNAGNPSTNENKAFIEKDMEEARKEKYVMKISNEEQVINDWKKLNPS